MYYEINVSLNGCHLFATDERSITHIGELKALLPIFLQKFPESEGYNITASEYHKTGKGINIKKLLKG